MTLSTLIEKLQTAEGPSRELDARIHALVYPDQMIMIDGGSVRFKTPATYAPIHTLDLSHWNDWEGLAGIFGVDRLTASIDAAVAFMCRVGTMWPRPFIEMGTVKEWHSRCTFWMIWNSKP